MKTVYYIDTKGKKITVEVSEAVADAMCECRRLEWRIESRERYHRLMSLDGALGENIGLLEKKMQHNEENTNSAFWHALKMLTKRQKQIVKMLTSGMSGAAIAANLGVSKQSINDIKKAIQKKLKVFLK